jgi:transcriptional regulator with XRE-family HTH domain
MGMIMVNPLSVKIRAKKLGVLIRDARSAAGKSAEECAGALGISNTTFETYEMGDKSPSLPELEALSYYLQVPFEQFWSQDVMTLENQGTEPLQLPKLISLRHRIIGALLRKARMDAGLSMAEVSRAVDISAKKIKSYEMGEKTIPLPELETLAGHLDLTIEELQDQKGLIGRWTAQRRSSQAFLELSPEMQAFVTKPVNLPYLEVAQRLSEMSVDKLRSVAEGLLEITL